MRVAPAAAAVSKSELATEADFPICQSRDVPAPLSASVTSTSGDSLTGGFLCSEWERTQTMNERKTKAMPATRRAVIRLIKAVNRTQRRQRKQRRPQKP